MARTPTKGTTGGPERGDTAPGAAGEPEATKRGEREPPAEPPYLKERGQFRALIVANPNYFGNLEISPFKPTLKILGNTTYE